MGSNDIFANMSCLSDSSILSSLKVSNDAYATSSLLKALNSDFFQHNGT